jgi:hypothetical protein
MASVFRRGPEDDWQCLGAPCVAHVVKAAHDDTLHAPTRGCTVKLITSSFPTWRHRLVETHYAEPFHAKLRPFLGRA